MHRTFVPSFYFTAFLILLETISMDELDTILYRPFTER